MVKAEVLSPVLRGASEPAAGASGAGGGDAQAGGPAPKRTLLEVLRREIRLRHFSIRTEEAYVNWARRFIRFHAPRHPREAGTAGVKAFLEHLAVEGQVASSTQNQALNALVFLYGQVLETPLGDLTETLRARRPSRLPVVLTKEEVQRVLAHLEGTHELIVRLLYGTGLRLLEGLRLRVKDSLNIELPTLNFQPPTSNLG